MLAKRADNASCCFGAGSVVPNSRKLGLSGSLANIHICGETLRPCSYRQVVDVGQRRFVAIFVDFVERLRDVEAKFCKKGEKKQKGESIWQHWPVLGAVTCQKKSN